MLSLIDIVKYYLTISISLLFKLLGSFLYILNGGEINIYVNIIYILVILSILGYIINFQKNEL
jgi:hypothetical protein